MRCHDNMVTHRRTNSQGEKNSEYERETDGERWGKGEGERGKEAEWRRYGSRKLTPLGRVPTCQPVALATDMLQMHLFLEAG